MSEMIDPKALKYAFKRWKHRVGAGKAISEAAENDDLDFEGKKAHIGKALRADALKLPRALAEQFEDFAQSIEDAYDVDEVDHVLEEMFDFADEARIWMGTI